MSLYQKVNPKTGDPQYDSNYTTPSDPPKQNYPTSKADAKANPTVNQPPPSAKTDPTPDYNAYQRDFVPKHQNEGVKLTHINPATGKQWTQSDPGAYTDPNSPYFVDPKYDPTTNTVNETPPQPPPPQPSSPPQRYTRDAPKEDPVKEEAAKKIQEHPQYQTFLDRYSGPILLASAVFIGYVLWRKYEGFTYKCECDIPPNGRLALGNSIQGPNPLDLNPVTHNPIAIGNAINPSGGAPSTTKGFLATVAEETGKTTRALLAPTAETIASTLKDYSKLAPEALRSYGKLIDDAIRADHETGSKKFLIKSAADLLDKVSKIKSDNPITKFNNRVFNIIKNALNLPSTDDSKEYAEALDKALEKIGTQGVVELISAAVNESSDQFESAIASIQARGVNFTDPENLWEQLVQEVASLKQSVPEDYKKAPAQYLEAALSKAHMKEALDKTLKPAIAAVAKASIKFASTTIEKAWNALIKGKEYAGHASEYTLILLKRLRDIYNRAPQQAQQLAQSMEETISEEEPLIKKAETVVDEQGLESLKDDIQSLPPKKQSWWGYFIDNLRESFNRESVPVNRELEDIAEKPVPTIENRRELAKDTELDEISQENTANDTKNPRDLLSRRTRSEFGLKPLSEQQRATIENAQLIKDMSTIKDPLTEQQFIEAYARFKRHRNQWQAMKKPVDKRILSLDHTNLLKLVLSYPIETIKAAIADFKADPSPENDAFVTEVKNMIYEQEGNKKWDPTSNYGFQASQLIAAMKTPEAPLLNVDNK